MFDEIIVIIAFLYALIIYLLLHHTVRVSIIYITMALHKTKNVFTWNSFIKMCRCLKKTQKNCILLCFSLSMFHF